MLDREELREIAAIKSDSSFFVSLYLNVNPVMNSKGGYVIHLKNMIKDISESRDKAVVRKIKDDLKRIEGYVTGNKREFKKGLAILSSSERSFWREYNFAVPVKNEIIVDNTPYIKPLLDIIDNYQRYAVILVDRESARLFLAHLGEIQEYGEIHTPDIPGKHKKGGWFALSQNHYERHVDYHVSLHLKDVIKKLEVFLSNQRIERIIFGGPEEAVLKVKEMLTKVVSEKVIGVFNVAMFAKSNEILEKAMPVMEEFERNLHNRIASELMTTSMKRENAVLGLEDVLNALYEGRVMRLVLVEDFKDSGYACKKCRYITKQKISTCPYCNSAVEDVNYLVDLAAQRAIENGALVDVIYDNKELSRAGGIGAFLRF